MRDATVFVLLAGLVVAGKAPTLDTLPYWDEMAWARAAHWLSERNLGQALPGIAPPAMFFGHPPGLHLILAAIWKLTGPSIAVAHALALVFALGGIIATCLLGRLLFGRAAGALAAVSLFLSPLYFTQSGMFLGDIPVAALGCLSVYFVMTGQYRHYLLAAIPMLFIKETAMAIVAAILVHALMTAPNLRAGVRRAAWLAVPLAPILLFFVWQKLASGSFFWIFDFEIGLIEWNREIRWTKLERVFDWLFVRDLRWVFTTAVLVQLILSPRFRNRSDWWFLVPVVVLGGFSFYVIFFLPRYLLPVLPYIYIAGAGALTTLPVPRVARLAGAVVLVCAMLWALATPRLEGNGEFHLAYRDVVAAHLAAATFIATEHPGTVVATRFPHEAQLTRPFLGYVDRPVRITWLYDQRLRRDDLVLLSSPGTHATPGALTAEARQRGLRLIRRFGRGAAVADVFWAR